MTLDIKQLIKDNYVTFDSYRQGHFYYRIGNPETARFNMMGDPVIIDFYLFPVPIEDIGTATLLSKDKAITFMRWIRKAIEDRTIIKIK